MTGWILTYDRDHPAPVGLREALCTLGNGFFATRGAAPEHVSDGTHHPGTYVGGVYNRLGSEVAGRWVENESLVNVPNWLPVTFRVGEGPWFGEPGVELVDERWELDLRRGVLSRRVTVRDAEGRETLLTQRRFVSMRREHLAAIETTIVPTNWHGALEVRTVLDGRVRNDGVERYAALPSEHLAVVGQHRVSDEVVCLVTETTQSGIRIAQAARTRVRRNGTPVEGTPAPVEEHGLVGHQQRVEVAHGDEVTAEKIVALFTSRDAGISEPGLEACDLVCHLPDGFDHLIEEHAVAWHHLWERAHIEVDPGAGHDGAVALLLRLHIFHLLQTASHNTVHHDAGVPARGLHGEAYRGHVFWDELFVFPFLSLRLPEITRALLLYRYRRLDQARRAAAEVGCRGAMFPWQSASNGREETQTLHLNPNSGRWLPDASHLQRHVNAAIAYNVWNYFLATGDEEFLRSFGGEMILEIARFWSSAATYNHVEDRYDLCGVMGPDEYHEGYPDREEPGLDNNAYTNVMAVWCLRRALDVLATLPPGPRTELTERLGVTAAEIARWEELSRRMRLCFHEDPEQPGALVLSQFSGYERLAELDWDGYRRRYGNIERLDRILEAEGDTCNRYQAGKQADVVMLFFLLSAEELAEILERLGYDYDDELIPRTTAYYDRRTSHGSTLSRVVHSWVHARGDRERSWSEFLEALHSDVEDRQGGTTAEGIHLGAMAGTLDLVQRCYTGLELLLDRLRLHPAIPPELSRLRFGVRYRGHLLHIDVTDERLHVTVDPDEGGSVRLEVDGVLHDLVPGEALDVVLGADQQT